MTNNIPKTNQLLFFMMPEETSMLLEFIREHDLIVYANNSETPDPSEYISFENISQVFICPRIICKQIKTYKVVENKYSIDRTTSPVIELDCSALRSNGLYCGRIYFHGGYEGREGWVAYPDILHEYYKKIIAFIKKMFLTKERIHGAYVSKDSLLYVSGGGLLRQ